MKLTATQLRRIIKEEVAAAMSGGEHAADCNFGEDDKFICDTCGREVCYCQGGADDMPDTCTDCWADAHRMEQIR